jgi:2'-5' RNA ligase/endonuclease/exonuclease/phosphatase family metal-dependent hydrolase
MASPTRFSSTQTALAILAPTHLSAEIDTIRSFHDKAFGKWQPHINILYPFVPLDSLSNAVKIIRAGLLDERNTKFKLEFDDIGVFRHRNNATVYLKPTTETEEQLQQLRTHLISCLGADKTVQSMNGLEYRPHLTLGQANLNSDGELDVLDEKARKLLTIEWDTAQLIVLKRNNLGEMVCSEELQLRPLDSQVGQSNQLAAGDNPTRRSLVAKTTASSSWRGWRHCYGIDEKCQWYPLTEEDHVQPKQSKFLISSFNLMIEDHAPPFEHRLPAMERFVAQMIALTADVPKVLCLQEVNSEMLSLIYGSPFFRENFPYSTHTPDSQMQSIRNQVVISSVPFRLFSLQYPQRHKSSLVVKFIDYGLTVVNIHLTSALTDDAVAIKKEQMKKLTHFLTRHDMLHQTVLAGDFNVTTSSETIRIVLEKGLIRPETVQELQGVIDPGLWSDAFLSTQAELLDANEEDLYPGEEGATFDRINNPLAAMSKAPIDNRPQRLDRILYTSAGSIELNEYDRFAIPQSPNMAISDHYGVFATVYAREKKAQIGPYFEHQQEGQKIEDITFIDDNTEVHAFIQPFLPSDEDRSQRTEALNVLKTALLREPTLADAIIAPLGSYAMDSYFEDSDVDILVIGSVTSRAFFETVTSGLEVTTATGNTSRVHLINSLVQIAETSVNGIKVDLQYCQAPELLEKYVSHALKYINSTI